MGREFELLRWQTGRLGAGLRGQGAGDLKCGRVDALILLPIWGVRSDEVSEFYESRGKPVVHINPPSAYATENFVSADFFEAGNRLGEAWRKTGRKDIVYVGQGELSESISTRLRCLGLMSGLRVGLDASIRFRHARLAS